MATAAPPADNATEFLRTLAIDAAKVKNNDVPDAKKPPVQPGSDVVEVASMPVPSYDRSLTPVIPDYMDPTLCYSPNGYVHQAYYYGSYGCSINEWDHDYFRYVQPEGVDMSHGLYGEPYHHGYGYSPYGAYPLASPLPTVGHDGNLYGPQHYQYPASYYQPPTSSSFTPTLPPNSQGDKTPVVFNQAPAVDTTKTNSNSKNGKNEAKWLPRFGSPNPWLDQVALSVWQHRPDTSSTVSTTPSHANNLSSSRNQNHQPLPNYLGLPPSSMGSAAPGFSTRMYQNRGLYSNFGNAFRSSQGFNPNGFNYGMNCCSPVPMDKFQARLRGNGFHGYGNENMDGLNELNRGPRSGCFQNNQKILGPNVILEAKGQSLPTIPNKEDMSLVPDRDQYNQADFPENYKDAKFYIIKSYSEDDIHKSVKYSVWASTPNGNKKLDAGYTEAQEKSGGCPVFLFFSVNTSGQFVGVAEMVGPVDFNKTVDYWQQDKWNGCFPVKWHIVKDVPNSTLKHIILENNDNKPVTNSRDTQEVMFDQGIQLLKLFKDHVSKTSVLDDFIFYEARQKAVQDKRAKQQFRKQVYGTTAAAREKDGAPVMPKLSKPLEVLDKETDQEKPSNKTEVVKVSYEATKVVNAVPEKHILTNCVADNVLNDL